MSSKSRCFFEDSHRSIMRFLKENFPEYSLFYYGPSMSPHGKIEILTNTAIVIAIIEFEPDKEISFSFSDATDQKTKEKIIEVVETCPQPYYS